MAEVKTMEEALAAVKRNGLALEHVPEELKTPEVCLEAVRQNGGALYWTPKEMRTPEVCMAAVEADRNERLRCALYYVPDRLKTPELCEAAVASRGWALKYVPDALKTPELCMEAVRRDGGALAFVPQALKTEAMCMEAALRDGAALLWTPEKWMTPEICMAAVKAPLNRIGSNVLKYVPDALRTPELCLAAVRQNPAALDSVPEAIRDDVRLWRKSGMKEPSAEWMKMLEDAWQAARDQELFSDRILRVRTEDLPEFCARFNEGAAMPDGGSPRLKLNRLPDGRIKCEISAGAEDGGERRLLAASYRSEMPGREVAASRALAAFVGKTEREDMPPELKKACLAGFRHACGMPEPKAVEEPEPIRPGM